MIYTLQQMKYLCLALTFFVVLFLTGERISIANPSNDDSSINDVQEFNLEGIDVLLRESKETPVVTAVLFLRGGTSAMAESEPTATEYFAMEVVPQSGSELTTKQRFRRVKLRMGSDIVSSDGRDYSVLTMRSTRERSMVSG